MKLMNILNGSGLGPRCINSCLLQSGFHIIKLEEYYQAEDRPYIVAQRRKYLESIKRFRKEGKKIFYTDETFIQYPNIRRKGVWVNAAGALVVKRALLFIFVQRNLEC
jgi:hypothetical protein